MKLLRDVALLALAVTGLSLAACEALVVIDPLRPPSPARWQLDPAAPPAPGDTSFVALVNEIECSGGRDIGGKLLPPVIDYQDDRIVVELFLEPLPAIGPNEAFSCPLPPPTRFIIRLEEPIGDRQLIDAHGGTGGGSDH